eukprot:815523-Rhodomonas_salina.1
MPGIDIAFSGPNLPPVPRYAFSPRRRNHPFPPKKKTSASLQIAPDLRLLVFGFAVCTRAAKWPLLGAQTDRACSGAISGWVLGRCGVRAGQPPPSLTVLPFMQASLPILDA